MDNQSPWLPFCYSTNHQLLLQWSYHVFLENHPQTMCPATHFGNEQSMNLQTSRQVLSAKLQACHSGNLAVHLSGLHYMLLDQSCSDSSHRVYQQKAVPIHDEIGTHHTLSSKRKKGVSIYFNAYCGKKHSSGSSRDLVQFGFKFCSTPCSCTRFL